MTNTKPNPKAWSILLIGLFACNGNKADKPTPVETAERQYDNLKLVDLENRRIDLRQYKGKTIFINFWATWCKPCLQEMPSIDSAQTILLNENIVFLFASWETAKVIDSFRNKNSYKFNYIRVENRVELNILAIPTTVIYNPEGKLVFSEVGYRVWNDENSLDLIRKAINL